MYERDEKIEMKDLIKINLKKIGGLLPQDD